MKKTLGIALLALALSPLTAVAGETMDIKNATCQELMQQDEEALGVMLFWLDGYLSGVTGDTSFSLDNLNAFAEAIGVACAKSPEARLLDTAKIVGIK